MHPLKGRAHPADCNHCEANRRKAPKAAATYGAVHLRLRRLRTDEPCAHADATCKGRIEAALSHETPPDRIRFQDELRKVNPWSPFMTDYIRLCRSHHRRYDHSGFAMTGQR